MSDYAKIQVQLEWSDDVNFVSIDQRNTIDEYAGTTDNTMHITNKKFPSGGSSEVEFGEWTSVEVLIIKNLNKERYIDLSVPTAGESAATLNRLDAGGIFITTDFDVSVASGLLGGTPESGYDVNCEIIAFGT